MDAIIPDCLGSAVTELAPDVANFKEVQEGTFSDTEQGDAIITDWLGSAAPDVVDFKEVHLEEETTISDWLDCFWKRLLYGASCRQGA